MTMNLTETRYSGLGSPLDTRIHHRRPVAPVRPQKIGLFSVFAVLILLMAEENTAFSISTQQRRTYILPLQASVAPEKSSSAKRWKKYPKNEIKQKFKRARELERKGQWRKASSILEDILKESPSDAHSHLALARLEARRSPDSEAARKAFQRGVEACPRSIHLLQAWAVFEESKGNDIKAKELFQKALVIDEYNPYVCHAYGLLEKKLGHPDRSRELWEHALKKSSTAALVCQLGEYLIANKDYEGARELYEKHIIRIDCIREKTEVYLAYAWLEEKYFSNYGKAEDILEMSIKLNPSSSLAQVALARLSGRQRHGGNGEEATKATIRKLATACLANDHDKKGRKTEDGRVFNTWASLEAKAKRFRSARRILDQGIQKYPEDHTLLHAAGKMEERMGNFTGAKELYGASLRAQPAAPTLVSMALLELKRPSQSAIDFSYIRKLFQEALLIDPRHGPVYNSFGNFEFHHGNIDGAREIFCSGVHANCSDAASVYHGFAKMELSLGNVTKARELLEEGLRVSRETVLATDTPKKERAAFLIHTLGMLELNSNRPANALALFLEGIDLYGSSSQLLLGAAMCEVKLGNEAKARKLFERAVLADERHAQAWQAWAIMEARGGNWRTAKMLFESGLKNCPSHGPLWLNYAVAEGRLGSVEAARQLFTQGLKRNPNHTPLYQAWGQLEMKAENYSSAKILISEALTRDKSSGAAWLMAADIESKLGNSGLVALILRRGIECAPATAGLYRALGSYLQGRGKYNEAREVYEQGIAVDPMDAPLYHSLAELEAQLFNIEGLAKLNERAAKIFKTNVSDSNLSSGEAWATKIRANRAKSLPKNIIALTQRIVADSDVDVGAEGDTVDPNVFIDRLSRNLLEDDGPVGGLLQFDVLE